MRKYELVCVIESTLASTDANALIERIENILAGQSVTISETDDMGLVPVAYPLNGQDQARIVSYCVAADPAVLGEVKSQLRLEKGLAKYFFYAMHENEDFMKFADLKKTYEDMTAVEEEEEVEEEQSEEAQD